MKVKLPLLLPQIPGGAAFGGQQSLPAGFPRAWSGGDHIRLVGPPPLLLKKQI